MLSQLLAALLSITISHQAVPDRTFVHESKQIHCLAETIYHEARGESFEGQRAVAAVVLNRTLDDNFPDTICKVVYQRNQFSWVGKVRRPNPNDPAFKRANFLANIMIAKYTLGLTYGPEQVYNATFFSRGPVQLKYHRVAYLGMIGAHKFYELNPDPLRG